MPGMNSEIAEQLIVSRVAADIFARIGPMDDLPDEVANTVANVFYRFHSFYENLSNNPDGMNAPGVAQSADFVSAFKQFNEHSSEVIALYKTIPDVVAGLRTMLASNSEYKDRAVGMFLDAYKYKISGAHNKSRITRWIERQLNSPSEIQGLIKLVRASASFSNTEHPKSSPQKIASQKTDAISDLHWSAASGDLEKTKSLLCSGVEVNAQMSIVDENIRLCDGATALHLACANGTLHIVEALLSAGADPSITTRLGDTPMHWAVDVSDDLVSELLLSGADHLQKTNGGEIALHWACRPSPTLRWGSGSFGPILGFFRNSSARIIDILVNQGSPVNQQDNLGRTPLHWSSLSTGDAQDLVNMLLIHRANLSIADNDGDTALMKAIYLVNPVVAAELLKCRATLPDGFDSSALIEHLSKKRKTESLNKLVRLLIEKKIFSEGQDGVAELIGRAVPRDSAFSIQQDRLAELDTHEAKAIVRGLLKKGANVNAGNVDGVTPLMVAAGAGNSALKKGRAFTDIFFRSE